MTSAPCRSIATAITVIASPRAAASLSSVGISATQGAHQVAHRLTSNGLPRNAARSEEHTSELQSLMRISYAVFCLKKKKSQPIHTTDLYKTTQATHIRSKLIMCQHNAKH